MPTTGINTNNTTTMKLTPKDYAKAQAEADNLQAWITRMPLGIIAESLIEACADYKHNRNANDYVRAINQDRRYYLAKAFDLETADGGPGLGDALNGYVIDAADGSGYPNEVSDTVNAIRALLRERAEAEHDEDRQDALTLTEGRSGAQ